MAGYQTPGVTVTEVTTPNTAIVLDRPTVVGLVGHAQGNDTHTETALLIDNDPYTLYGANPITTPADSFVVRDTVNLGVVYEAGSAKDYVLTTDNTTGVTTIKRSLYTTMASTEKVVVVANATVGETSSVVYFLSEGGAQFTNMNYQYASEPMATSNNGTVDITGEGDTPTDVDISVQRAGAYVIGSDYIVNTSNSKIRRSTSGAYSPTGCHIFSGQKVYVSYTTTNSVTGAVVSYVDQEKTLTSNTEYALNVGDNETVNLDTIVVRNCPGMGTITSVAEVFTAGTNGTSGVDFQFTFVEGGAQAKTVLITRNTSGPTTMNVANNRVNVRIDYKYVPVDYYQPTLFTSFNEVEKKFGPAFDENGNVTNPLSAGAYMCFRAGSNEIVAQALFTTDANGKRVEGSNSNTNHWATTLESLRGQDAINVLVPVVGQSDLNVENPDDTMRAIFMKFVDHINVMDSNGEYVIAMLGEDSTVGGAIGTAASQVALQSHAADLGAQLYPERTALISPAAFKFANPVSGGATLIGGQYVACSLAGMMANAPIQTSLTRKQVVSITDVATFRNEAEKTQDAESGLMVIENKNGVIRVRHAVTTAITDAVKRELNAMRSKFFMIETVRKTLDTNVIGQIISDARAPFLIRTQIVSVLDSLRNSGVITGYGSVTVDAVVSNPTAMTVRFSYSLPFSVNNIEVVVGLDTITGTVTAQ